MKKRVLSLALLMSVGISSAFSQDGRTVKGVILDDKGSPAAGAEVRTSDGSSVFTEEDGSFEMVIPAGASNEITVVMDGFASQTTTAGDNVVVNLMQQASGEVIIYGKRTSVKTLIGGTTIIDKEAFANNPTGSFTNMLQGKSTGLQITAGNGAPGQTAFMRLRGTTSISSGNQPLIVIDGVVADANLLNSLNPSDIENVAVLSDASTTSIYGSRGANGVISITTKAGSGASNVDRPATISVGSSYGFKNRTSDGFKLMNFDEKLKFERDLGFTNPYLDPIIAAGGYSSVSDVPDNEIGSYWEQLRPNETNWLSDKKGSNPLLRTGTVQQHDLSISGTSGKINYFLSGQIYDEDGIGRSSYFGRKSGSFSASYRANNWLRVGQNIRAAHTSGRELRDRNNVQNPFRAMYDYNPYESPYDFTANGFNGYNLMMAGFNILEAMQNNPSFYTNMYMLSSTFAEIKPIDEVVVKTQLALQGNTYQGESFMKPGSILNSFVGDADNPGSKSDGTSNSFNYVFTNTAEYTKLFKDRHNFSALIGTEFTQNNAKSYNLRGIGLPNGVSTLENAAKPESATTSKSGWAMMSYFARLQYDLDNKYSINLTGRRDGSSRFGDQVRYGNFGAVGASWNLKQEDFLSKNNNVNALKLWASVGTQGNSNIGNYTHMAFNSFTSYNGQSAVVPSSIGNPLLTWEKSSQASVGVDFRLFKDVLEGKVIYYNRNSFDMIFGVPVSPTTGFNTQTSNAGSMRNQGVEVMLSANIINKKDLSWTVGANFTYNQNRITALVDADTVVSYSAANASYVVGQPIDVYRLRQYAGVEAATGLPLYYLENGSTTTDYNLAPEVILENKSPDPKYFGGIFSNLRYKGLELNVLFSYQGGGHTYNQVWANLNQFSNYQSNLNVDMLDYWTPENTTSSNPAPDLNDNTYGSDRWLQKSDFIRLRNLTLAYNLPSKWFNNKLTGVRIYVQGQNLWYYAPEYRGDPEVGIGSSESDLTRVGNVSLYSYPQTRAITFGINFNL